MFDGIYNYSSIVSIPIDDIVSFRALVRSELCFLGCDESIVDFVSPIELAILMFQYRNPTSAAEEICQNYRSRSIKTPFNSMSPENRWHNSQEFFDRYNSMDDDDLFNPLNPLNRKR